MGGVLSGRGRKHVRYGRKRVHCPARSEASAVVGVLYVPAERSQCGVEEVLGRPSRRQGRVLRDAAVGSGRGWNGECCSEYWRKRAPAATGRRSVVCMGVWVKSYRALALMSIDSCIVLNDESVAGNSSHSINECLF